MRAAIRVQSLSLGGTGKTLVAMERHGKREDQTSQKRRVRNEDPIVFGSLNLRQAYDEHVKGCKMNKALKRPVLHALLQFPTDLPVNETNLRAFMNHSIRFINETHGGNAVFAARIDRDEQGQHSVDVFFAPKYEKATKQHGVEMWVSPTKHGKELCEKHREEIERRHGGKFHHGPRQVGIALNSEFRNFLISKGLKIKAKVEKAEKAPDRVEPELVGAKKQIARLKAKLLEQSNKIQELEGNVKLLEETAQKRENYVSELDDYSRSLEKHNKRLSSALVEVFPYLSKPLTFFDRKIQDIFISLEEKILTKKQIPENEYPEDHDPPSFKMGS